MPVIINGEEIPPNTLSIISITMGGNAHIQGEAINEQDRADLDEILNGFNQGDTVEFDVEDKGFHRMHGAGEITAKDRNEEGVGGLMRIKYIIGIHHIP